MLLQRILTALVLLALLLPALFATSPWPFALFTGLMIFAAGWEWGRLNGLQGARAWVLGLLTVAMAALLSRAEAGSLGARGWSFLWIAVTLAWAVGGALALRAGPVGWGLYGARFRQGLGVFVLALAWMAMLEGRAKGLNFLMSVFCLVWVADSAAYLGGRLLGRHKLALTISPGKTWEGAFSGAVAVWGLAALWTHLVDGTSWVDSQSIFGCLRDNFGSLGLLAAVWFLTALAIVGDLFESLLKRSVGVKDSSGLLPGHGGVLDRIDALMPVFPAALAMCSIRGLTA